MFLLWFYRVKIQKKISSFYALKSRADESEKGGFSAAHTLLLNDLQ